MFLASFLNIPFRQKNTMQLRTEAARTDVHFQGLKRTIANVFFSNPPSIADGK
jgi:hypothetical protein